MPAHIVLFDLGNVVVDWQPLYLYRQLFPTEDAAREFCATVCTMGWHVQHDLGVPMADNAAALIARYPQHETEIKAWSARWLDMFGGYVPGVPALMARLEEARVPLYGLSNIPAEVAERTFNAFPMIKLLRDVVVSGAEKVIKPDPRIYEITLARMGHPAPGEVFFIDDSQKNVDAAAALGFRTHHFKNAARLEQALIGEGLL